MKNTGYNLIVEVKILSGNQHNGYPFYHVYVFIEFLWQKNYERNKPIDKEVHIKNNFEATIEAMDEIFCFFGYVSVPNKHKLGECKISPNDGKHKDVPGKVKQMAFI